ncbi:MAG: DNA topoisomerase [Nitrososphaerales archaeon]
MTEKQRMGQLIASALGQYRTKAVGGQGKRKITSYEVLDYVIVPLSGHIMNYVTPKELERWTHASVDAILNDAKSLVKVLRGSGYSQALRNLALNASEVIIATDSDDEGENIGLEVLEILRGIQRPVRRLWLTTTVSSDIRESFSRLRQFNYNLALSVEARRKVDAIVGFSATREITLSLKYKVGKGVLSFGRVQTTTLLLVVEREREITNFVPKPYWEITAKVKNTTFVHQSSPFSDRAKAYETFEKVRNAKQFVCSNVREETSLVQPPKPMNTSDMLKAGSSFLHLSPSKVLALAEELYLSSIITYPRVDNQTYNQSFSHRENLQKLSSGNNFKDYASMLLQKNLTTPTRGRFSEDHEPITPIASITEYPKNPLAFRLYELILRHYLSIFGPPAKFVDTTVDGSIQSEPFRAEGRKLLDRGFYSVYYYPPKEKVMIDAFHANTTYLVERVDILEKKTEPPPRYSNSTLLAEMERVGIGTKSTRPTMIETLKDRQYVRINRDTIYPMEKGMKLIEYIEMPWGNYISPKFTSRVEEEMDKVARGEKNWEELVSSEKKTFAEAVATFRQIKG